MATPFPSIPSISSIPSAKAAPRLLVVEHEDSCPAEFVGEWLSAEGLDLDVRRPYRGEGLPQVIADHDGLLVLGGEMGAYDDATYPWLTRAKALIRDAVAAGTPVWGICLGHQLMTVALGGEVRVNPAGRATGLTPVGWSADSLHDPLCGGVRRDAVAVQWNNDVATALPADAVVLADSPDGTPQVVRFAPRAWGVQFHPETGGSVFALWTVSARERESADPAVDAALDDIRAHETLLRETWRPMAKAFAALLS